MPFYVFCLVTPSYQIEYFDIYALSNFWNTQYSIWIIDIITTSTAFIYFNTERIKHTLIIVGIYYFCSCVTYTLHYSLKHILKNLHLMD